MIWPFRKNDPLLDVDVLDELLATGETRQNIGKFLDVLEVQGRDCTPEELAELGREQGLNLCSTQLLVALAWRTGAFG